MPLLHVDVTGDGVINEGMTGGEVLGGGGLGVGVI